LFCFEVSYVLSIYANIFGYLFNSGIIKTYSKEYAPLAAHLSTKYCDMVSKLSRSLPRMLEVTKLSRLEAWPKSFEASGPTDDNIALYFFLDKMRCLATL
jgi:hypothetical protein